MIPRAVFGTNHYQDVVVVVFFFLYNEPSNLPSLPNPLITKTLSNDTRDVPYTFNNTAVVTLKMIYAHTRYYYYCPCSNYSKKEKKKADGGEYFLIFTTAHGE